MKDDLLIVSWNRQNAVAHQLASCAIARLGGLLRVEEAGSDLCVAVSETAVAKFRYHRFSLMIFGELRDAEGVLLRRIDLRSGAQASEAEIASEIVARYWGRYALITLGSEAVNFLVDPSGQVQAHRLSHNGVSMVGTRLDRRHCAMLKKSITLDPEAIARVLVTPPIAVYESQIEGVEPVIPGRLVVLAGNQNPKTIWSPGLIARSQRTPDKRRLRRVVAASCAAAVDETTAILLSGGLDSSIVLGSLDARQRPKVAVNFVTRAEEGDERAYARAVAAVNGVTLREVQPDAHADLRRLADVTPGPRPFIFGLDSSFEDATGSICRDVGATRLITGQGGDAIFFQPATSVTLLDRIQCTGLRALRPSSLADEAHRDQTSVWALLASAARGLFRETWRSRRRFADHLLASDLRGRLGGVDRLHPWLDDTDSLSAAKRIHLVLLADSQLFMTRRALGHAIEQRHPLLSQPIVEELIALPVSSLVYGPMDRAFARSTFADRLPPVVRDRRSKGAAANHYSRAVAANLPFLRDFLLGGALESAGVVDRVAMEQALTSESLFYSNDYTALIIHVACEAWARYWTSAGDSFPYASFEPPRSCASGGDDRRLSRNENSFS
ncbi:MAG: asparagine synthase C-terminal domain-containing protein [Pseudomonadota bacterium]